MKSIKTVMQQSDSPATKGIKATLADVTQELAIPLKLTRHTIEREQEAPLTVEQASMLFDVCTNLRLTPSQIIFVIGKYATDNYGLFSFDGDLQ